MVNPKLNVLSTSVGDADLVLDTDICVLPFLFESSDVVVVQCNLLEYSENTNARLATRQLGRSAVFFPPFPPFFVCFSVSFWCSFALFVFCNPFLAILNMELLHFSHICYILKEFVVSISNHN